MPLVVTEIEGKFLKGTFSHQGENDTTHYHWRQGNCHEDPGGVSGLHGRVVVKPDPA